MCFSNALTDLSTDSLPNSYNILLVLVVCPENFRPCRYIPLLILLLVHLKLIMTIDFDPRNHTHLNVILWQIGYIVLISNIFAHFARICYFSVKPYHDKTLQVRYNNLYWKKKGDELINVWFLPEYCSTYPGGFFQSRQEAARLGFPKFPTLNNSKKCFFDDDLVTLQWCWVGEEMPWPSRSDFFIKS